MVDVPFEQNGTDVNVVSESGDYLSISQTGAAKTHISGANNDKTVSASQDNRLLTQTFGATMMEEGFLGNTIDTVNRWNETIVGGASKSVIESTLIMSVTTGATDSIELEFKKNNIIETVGGFAQFSIGYKYGTLIANNVREFGYRDQGKNDGAFFRYTGTSLDFVTVKTGIESTVSLNAFIPNGNFHLYGISHLGSGKVGVFIDNILVHDFDVLGASLVGDKEKKPFVKNYNTAAPAGTPADTEIHWMNMVDLSGAKTTITGRDDNNNIVDIAATAAGRLLVSQEATPPSDVNVIENTSHSGTVDKFDTITPGETWLIKGLTGGAQSSNSGTIIELFEDATGTGTPLVKIEDGYVNGSSFEKSLNVAFVGDGTRRILLRRRHFGGGSFETTGRWAADII